MTTSLEPQHLPGRIIALSLAITLACCSRQGGTPPRATPTAEARGAAPRGDEATRLDKAIEVLSDQGKLREAIPLAERALAHRERALGPRPPRQTTPHGLIGKQYRAHGE